MAMVAIRGASKSGSMCRGSPTAHLVIGFPGPIAPVPANWFRQSGDLELAKSPKARSRGLCQLVITVFGRAPNRKVFGVPRWFLI
jgi:hypothetical protein